MLKRTRVTSGAAILATTLAMAMAVVVTSFSHEEDEVTTGPPTCSGPEPDPGQPVAMPVELIGLEIALGQKDGQPAGWEGDVKVSPGKVAAVDFERTGPNAEVSGAHFSVGVAKAQAKANPKKKKNQAKAAAKKAAQATPVLRVTLRVQTLSLSKAWLVV